MQGMSRCHVANRATAALAGRTQQSRPQKAELHIVLIVFHRGWNGDILANDKNNPSACFETRRRVLAGATWVLQLRGRALTIDRNQFIFPGSE